MPTLRRREAVRGGSSSVGSTRDTAKVTSFQKKLTKTAYKCMTIPAWFVKAHRAKIGRQVKLQYIGGPAVWSVTTHVYTINKYPHVSFGGGWRDFMDYYHLLEGQRVRFTFRRNSFFAVKAIGDTYTPGSHKHFMTESIRHSAGTKAQYCLPNSATRLTLPRSFNRIMTKSSPKCMTLPAWFVRTYGDQFHGNVQVKMAGNPKLWPVKVHVHFMKKNPHVSFGSGWKNFMFSNNLGQGLRLEFTLLKISLFEVQTV